MSTPTPPAGLQVSSAGPEVSSAGLQVPTSSTGERDRLGELFGEVPPNGASGPEPVVRVVRGDPDALELAALIAGLTAAASVVVDPDEPATRHRWADRSHALRGGDRGLPERGANAWRWSLHP